MPSGCGIDSFPASGDRATIGVHRNFHNAVIKGHRLEMQMRGLGDRWLAGERIDGVSFQRHDAVEVMMGRYEGEAGRIELLMDLEPEARYLVKLASEERMVPVTQSSLRKTNPSE